MTKENIVAAKYLQQLLIQGKKNYSKSDIEKGGLDPSLKSSEIGNFKIEKDSLFGLYSISVMDKKKDIYGNPISEKSDFLHKVRSLWEVGKKQILFSDIYTFDIFTTASEIRIGNILLSNYLGFSKSYDISLIDKEKNKGMFGKSVRSEIEQLLNDFCTTREYCIELIRDYKLQFNANLIDDLKELTRTATYDTIKAVMNVFIEHEIVEEKYPHEIIEVN